MNAAKGIDLWVQVASWVSIAFSGWCVCWLLSATKAGVVDVGPAILVTLISVLQEAFLVFLVGVPALFWKRTDHQSMPTRVAVLYWVAFFIPLVQFVVLCSVRTTSMC